MVSDKGQILGSYDKVHLVPFGEYLPFQDFMESLGFLQLTGIRGGFSAGTGPRLLSIPGAPPARPLICYEIIFPDEVVDASQRPGWFLNVTNEFNYSGGTEIGISPKLTVNVDFIGRQLVDSGRLVDETKTFRWMTAAGVQGSTNLNEFAFQEGSVNLVTSAIGFKFNPWGNLLVSANVLFPLTDAGMRANPVPVFGFDYAF